MSDIPSSAARVEKVCLDNECSENWSKIPQELILLSKDFIYCPFCSEELHLHCSACKEALSSKDYKFCPWCGAKFTD
ncbi:MAG: hypothetical protein HQK55_17850 [Deltaproteobacteria bacterium]|nr:hypothetical protein [Deltaproteobacteria bacterium]